jgi:hypothetical protein
MRELYLFTIFVLTKKFVRLDDTRPGIVLQGVLGGRTLIEREIQDVTFKD